MDRWGLSLMNLFFISNYIMCNRIFIVLEYNISMHHIHINVTDYVFVIKLQKEHSHKQTHIAHTDNEYK